MNLRYSDTFDPNKSDTFTNKIDTAKVATLKYMYPSHTRGTI